MSERTRHEAAAEFAKKIDEADVMTMALKKDNSAYKKEKVRVSELALKKVL